MERYRIYKVQVVLSNMERHNHRVEILTDDLESTRRELKKEYETSKINLCYDDRESKNV